MCEQTSNTILLSSGRQLTILSSLSSLHWHSYSSSSSVDCSTWPGGQGVIVKLKYWTCYEKCDIRTRTYNYMYTQLHTYVLKQINTSYIHTVSEKLCTIATSLEGTKVFLFDSWSKVSSRKLEQLT